MTLRRIAALPARFLAESHRLARTDPSGLALEPVGAKPLDALLKPGVHLITAPPAHGKTFVARALAASTHSAVYVDLGGTPLPAWPAFTDGGLWVLDAVDEAERLQPNTALGFLEAIKDAEKCSVVLFCRELEVPKRVKDAVAAREGSIWRLVPITRDEARRMLGNSFDAVANALTDSRLRGLAPHPRALRVLARLLGQDAQSAIDPRLVWRSVLDELLDEAREGKPLTTSREERFCAVAQMAAMLLLIARDDFREGGGELALEDLVTDPKLRVAAREAVAASEVFAQGERIRFAAGYMRDWFAAFGLANTDQATRARPPRSKPRRRRLLRRRRQERRRRRQHRRPHKKREARRESSPPNQS